MSNIGIYILCAPGSAHRKELMYIDANYGAGAWNWLWERVQNSVTIARFSYFVDPKTVVIKYPWGQSCRDGSPFPCFFDMLALRQNNPFPNIITNLVPNLNVDNMTRFEDRCFRLGIQDIFYYVGQAPSHEAMADASDEDWRDIAMVMNASAGHFIIDSSCYPPHFPNTLELLARLETAGVRQVRRRVHGEAYPIGMEGWPNAAGHTCFGEDLAHHRLLASLVTFRCKTALLYGGTEPDPKLELPPDQFRRNARTAVEAGRLVALPIDIMHRAEPDVLRGILVGGAGEGANAQ